MKLTLPTADEVRNEQIKIRVQKSAVPRQLAEKFLEGKVADAIKGSIHNEHAKGVNVEIPVGAYSDLKQFVVICSEILRPLGYTCELSHDGGGMYPTLYVSWEIKNPRTSRVVSGLSRSFVRLDSQFQFVTLYAHDKRNQDRQPAREACSTSRSPL